LTSSVLKWPDRAQVDEAVRRWAFHAAARHPEILRIAYFGSYARGDWGVGSDLDLLLIVEDGAATPARNWDTSGIPVPADVLVYTRSAWDQIDRTSRFGSTIMREAVWVFGEARPATSWNPTRSSSSRFPGTA
jgi:hypothetical protein